MGMPKELFYKLNNAFAQVRQAEQEAARLEHTAAALRDRAQQEVESLYTMLNAASVTLAKPDRPSTPTTE